MQVFFHYATFVHIQERVDDHEYIGASISHDRCWEKHCNKITKKPNKTLGLLSRTLSTFPIEVKSKAYLILVRTQLEYASEA